ncbi:MAG: Bug family tripartite tricarboxylate transporter substrate binding protein [Burkholderiales bacterium]
MPGLRSIATLIGTLLCCASAAAQDYPSRTIRILTGTTAGGMVDTFGRSLASHLSQSLGAPVVLENRPGGSHMISHDAVAKAEPDGYTLLQNSQIGLVFVQGTHKSVPYDPIKDFTHITTLFSSPFYLLVHPAVPVQSVEELIAYARAHPGKLNYGSIGVGSMHHLGMELLSIRTGIRMVHVPYKGSAQMMPDILSGQIQLIFQGPTSSIPPAKAGKVRALAVTGPERARAMPQLPTMAQAGFPDFNVDAWFGLSGPANLPRPIIERLNRDTVSFLRNRETIEKSAADNIDLLPGSPEQLVARVRSEIPLWTKVMRAAGVQPE